MRQLVSASVQLSCLFLKPSTTAGRRTIHGRMNYMLRLRTHWKLTKKKKLLLIQSSIKTHSYTYIVCTTLYGFLEDCLYMVVTHTVFSVLITLLEIRYPTNVRIGMHLYILPSVCHQLVQFKLKKANATLSGRLLFIIR